MTLDNTIFSDYNLQQLDTKVFENFTHLLSSLPTISLHGKARKNRDLSYTTEFNQEILETDGMKLNISGFLNNTKGHQNVIFFVTISDMKNPNSVIKLSQIQHSTISKLIKEKL